MLPAIRVILPTVLLGAFQLANASEQLEEVVVTADFRREDLMSSAASISVLGDLEITERGARHLEDILSAAPNVDWSGGASRSRFIQIRGVGDLEQYGEPKYYPSVGLVLDDLELGASAAAGMLFDVSQVEVLRGPQGTRYGASAHAGLIKIDSNPPSDSFAAELHGGAGNYGASNIGLVVNGPLADTLQGRLALQQNNGDGYIDNAYKGSDNTANYDEFTGRARLAWAPDAASRYDLGVYRFDTHNGYDAFSLDNNRTTWTDQPGKDRQEIDAVTLKGSWQLGGNTLEAVASYLDGSQFYGYDADWVSEPFCQIYTCSYGHDTARETFDRDRDQATLELRLLGGADSLARGDLRYVLGLYGNRYGENLHYAYPSAWYGLYRSRSDYHTERYAAYGQLEYGISDALSATAGLRLERFQDDYRDSNGVSHDTGDDLLDAELSLQYTLGDATFVYATLALANKPGGVNVAASSQVAFMSPAFSDFMQDKLRFDSESLFSREVGVKTRQLGGRLELRTALFYQTRQHAQLESWMWDADAGLWIGYLDSTPDTDSYGLELESSLAVTDALQLFANLGLLHTDVDRITSFDLDQNQFVTRRHRDQAKSPSWQYDTGARLILPRGFTGSVEVTGRDDSYFGYYHDGKLDGYTLLNASLGWANEHVAVTVWGRNLTDKDYAVHGLYFGADPRDDFGAWSNQSYYQLGPPRTYGVDLTWYL